ncbi:MAG: 3-dehydroquinate synthase [Chiayiivirga sp.]|jgi:3-dehydroquinate synthase|uniref:3-dehydroquinate synthase n=1 Tax=Chiayiivirga sp. TaxID=2041042 RepID=UPI0025BE6C1C|nr:3-dehydroquinate synthase [Chiayiivirga sp.]MCI1728623.1 3-dehydroquinate synthase [Chiayiivirga sp.]
MSTVREVQVELGARRYPIRIGADLLDQGDWASQVRGRDVLVVTDAHVAPLYLARVEAALSGKRLRTLVLPPGEAEKTLARFGDAITALAELRANRDATVVALGGGVVGDLSGFAAACWMRGVAFIQLPTTLLAMVDSSVGGKTAVDLPQGKNLVGAFHQPTAVIADIATLATLPPRELRAGLAEVVKYGAICDPGFFVWLEQHAVALLARDEGVVVEAVERSCRHKAAIVARDEHETGERALLNFGHTFGHALETACGYGALLHGEAVAIGMGMAARLSSALGLAPPEDAERLARLLAHLGLPLFPNTATDPAELLELMRLDKKSVSGKLRLILWRGIGHAEVVPGVADADILRILSN